MNTERACSLFEALASDTRLEIFRLLVKNAPGGMVAGDIAATLNIPANNLSFHLKNLTHSGLVNMVREGRYLRYRASIPLMLEMIAYLTEECCSGNPAECRRFREASKVAPELLPRLEK